jgi:acetyl esterase
MALDPLVKMFLDRISDGNPPKLWKLPLPAARVAFASLATLAGPKNVPIGKTQNLMVPGPGGKLHVRIYTPVAAGGEALPALLFFHGGGFVFGNLDIYDGICRMLAGGSGARVVSVDYRLAPEHKFPAAVEDAYAALCWLEENAPHLGVDANRIAVGGDSAGGNLAAVISQEAKRRSGPRIVCQLLIAPMVDPPGDYPSRRDFAIDPILSGEAAKWFMEAYLTPETDWTDVRLSPLLERDFYGLPPAYFVLGGEDPLHDEGIAYAEKLRAAGVEATVADYADMMHDFVFLQSVLPQAHEAVTVAAAAMRELLAR